MLYENRYVISDQMMDEYIRKVLCRNIRLAGLVFALVSAVMLVFTIVDGMYVLAAVFGVCLIIMVAVPLLTPPLTRRQMRDASEKLHGGRLCETVIRFGEDIAMEEGTVNMRIAYGQIQRIIELPSVCVLVMGKQNAVLVDPKGFSVGGYKEFLVFIKEKTGAV
ncbi:MAG TPA: hypothetical protein DF613_16940 [Lachnospiraceae bacterium]|nr:hypothetical protein [Lachnospiraceae bacterium]